MKWFKRKKQTLLLERVREPVIEIAERIICCDESFSLSKLQSYSGKFEAYQINHEMLNIYVSKTVGVIDGWTRPEFGINKKELELLFDVAQEAIAKGREQQKDVERARLTKIFCQ